MNKVARTDDSSNSKDKRPRQIYLIKRGPIPNVKGRTTVVSYFMYKNRFINYEISWHEDNYPLMQQKGQITTTSVTTFLIHLRKTNV